MSAHRVGDREVETPRHRLTEPEGRRAPSEAKGSNRSVDLEAPERYKEALRAENQDQLRDHEALQAEQQRYVDLFENAPVGYLILDRDGTICQMNLRVVEMLGRARNEMLGWPLWSYLPRDCVDIPSRHLHEVFSRGNAYHEVKVRRADGSMFHAALESLLVEKENGAARHCRTALLDISARKRVEEALRESEERFRNLIEGSIEGICIHQNWKALFVNRAYAQMLGYESPQQVLALESLEACTAPHDRQRLNEYLYARLKGEPAPVHYEFDAIRKDGSSVVLENVVRVIQWKGTLAVQDTVVDITGRKRAEEQVRQREAELSHVARLSTMGEMATMLAHEINQPLTAIVSYAEGAARRYRSRNDVNDALLTVLEQTATMAKRAAEIVRGLRNFVRKQDVRLERVRLNEVIQEAKRFTAVETRNKGITVTTDLMPALPEVEGNFTQLEQVVLNLIRNGVDAIDRSEDSKGELRLRTWINDEGKIQLSVEDSGPGVSHNIVERLFDPFVTTKPDGLGIGLSVSRTIVEAHGGRIWVDSHDGVGTTFHMTLPIRGGARDRRA